MGLIQPNIKRMQKKQDVPGLMAIVQGSDQDRAREAAAAIAAVGDSGTAQLVRFFETCIEESQPQAGWVLETLESAGWRPDTEKLQRDVLCARGAWLELADLGDPRAVPGLLAMGPTVGDARRGIEALGNIKSPEAVTALAQELESNAGMTGEQAITALEEIAGFGAADVLVGQLKDGRGLNAAKALERMEWEPTETEDEYRFLCALGRWSDVENLGEPAVELLVETIDTWKPAYNKPRNEVTALGSIGGPRAAQVLTRMLEALNQEKPPHIATSKDEYARVVARALARTGEKSGAEAVITHLMNTPGFWSYWHDDLVACLSDLFEGFTTCLVRIASVDQHLDQSARVFSYDLKPNLDALESLCSMTGPVTSNFLHLIADRQDFMAPNEGSDVLIYSEGLVSVQPLRDRAADELEERGSPAYDSEAYLDRSLWSAN